MATASSVDPSEIAKFSALAAEWWNPHGQFRPLHRFNPVRLAFLRETAAQHWKRDARAIRPFGGLKVLDIGCGGGLLAEPLARMGFEVLGIDAAEDSVRAAAAHSANAGLKLNYRTAAAEELAQSQSRFDYVLAMEVIEHVANPEDFVATCAQLVAPGGLFVVATINRTLKSLALAKIGAEYVLRWLPRGSHDWNRFITPGELQQYLTGAGLTISDIQGVRFDPLRWDWQLASDTDVNYMIVAEK